MTTRTATVTLSVQHDPAWAAQWGTPAADDVMTVVPGCTVHDETTFAGRTFYYVHLPEGAAWPNGWDKMDRDALMVPGQFVALT